MPRKGPAISGDNQLGAWHRFQLLLLRTECGRYVFLRVCPPSSRPRFVPGRSRSLPIITDRTSPFLINAIPARTDRPMWLLTPLLWHHPCFVHSLYRWVICTVSITDDFQQKYSVRPHATRQQASDALYRGSCLLLLPSTTCSYH